jgi:hypothetical protein
MRRPRPLRKWPEQPAAISIPDADQKKDFGAEKNQHPNMFDKENVLRVASHWSFSHVVSSSHEQIAIHICLLAFQGS